jgi:hypothetical protein
VKTYPDLSHRRRVFGLAAVLCASLPALAAVPPPTREDAARLRLKVEAIERNGEARRPTSLVTRLTEREVNAYLAYDVREQLPPGLTEPRITVLADLKLSGTATIDLDAIRRQRQARGWLDPLNYLGGKVPVALSGSLTASGGLARFAFDKATVGGVPVPKIIVQELVTFYSKTPGNPRGLNIDDPFPLPARIRQIEIRPGEAVVKQ